VDFLDLFWAADWDGFYRFFAKGSPPLIFQLLALNTVILMLLTARRIAAKHRMRSQTMEVVQVLLLAANLVIVFQEEVLRWVKPFI
jgi:heme/copper-type cytochrome/quinol oxidase subunit 3